MSKSKTKSVTVITDCVVEGKNVKAGKSVTCSNSDANYLVASGLAADPKTDEGKLRLEQAEAEQKAAADAKKSAKS